MSVDYQIQNSEGIRQGEVKMASGHTHDPLKAFSQTTAWSHEELKGWGWKAVRLPLPEKEPISEEFEPWQREIIARGEVNERLYVKLEETLRPPLLSADMLERMNLCMGFDISGPHSKDPSYRPYCGNPKCKDQPRMMLHEHGFQCWSCKNIWDLRPICKHDHPRGDGTLCQFGELEKMPIGYRCPRCAGMHHLTGRKKDPDSIILCDLDCCCPPGFKENTVREKTGSGPDGARWDIRCRKGLWAASAPELKDAMREAKHYYAQYHDDGEYTD